jgi:hypothetical protein
MSDVDGVYTSTMKRVVLLEEDDDWLMDSLSDDGIWHSNLNSTLPDIAFFPSRCYFDIIRY